MRHPARAAAAAVAAMISVGDMARALPAGQNPPQPPEALDPRLGKAAALDIESDWVWVEAGARLLRRPDPASGYFLSVDVRSQLPVLERRDGWLLVRYGSSRGWISTSGEHSAAKPTSVGPSAGLRRTTRASEVFRLRQRAEPLGSFALYTDVADESILKVLDRTSSHLEAAYRKRFGLAGEPTTRETVLLFANEADYRAFAQEDSAGITSDLRGHATPELAVLFAGDHPTDAVAAVLIHELTHLLNRRVFGDAIPPWIEEGLANDLAFCRVDSRGRARLGTVGGRSVMIEQPEYDSGGFIRVDKSVRLTGPVASLRILKERWRQGDAVSLLRLTQAPWFEFSSPQNRELHYSTSVFLVRYLLDGGDENLSEGFMSFLRAVSRGEPADGQALELHVGVSIEELEGRFGEWLSRQRVPS